MSNITVVHIEKPGDHEIQLDSSSEEHECPATSYFRGKQSGLFQLQEHIKLFWISSPRWSFQSLWKSGGPASRPSPCGPADGPWSANERERDEGRRGGGRRNFKKRGCNRAGHSMVADVQIAKPIMHKIQRYSSQSSLSSTQTQQPIHSSVSVGVGNVSTNLAADRKPTTQLVRIRTHSYDTLTGSILGKKLVRY